MNKYKKLRKEINISQAQLADMLGVSQTAVSQWETDKNYPDVNTLKTLSEIFCVSTDYLLGMDTGHVHDVNEAIVYTRVPAGIDWSNNIDRDGTVEISSTLLAKGRDYIGYKVDDDRLAPLFCQNDILIIEVTNRCEDGDLALIQVSGYDAQINYYFRNTQGVLIQPVVAAQRGRFFPDGHKEKPRIIGVVRELRRSF